MVFKIFIERKAEKQLNGLPKDVRNRVIIALKELEKGFSARLDVKKMQGTRNHYRIRVR